MKYTGTSPLMSRFTPRACKLLVTILTGHDAFRGWSGACRGWTRTGPPVVDLGQVTSVAALVVKLAITELTVYDVFVKLAVLPVC